MQFVFPEFLWALLAIAIPILIHIFNFRRTKRVFFSNVALLQAVKTQTNQFRRLKHLLILLTRIATIMFLVLAFAQPYLPSQNRQSIQNTQGLVSIYLDNSFSMQSETNQEKALDIATRYINDLLKVFPKSARFQVVTNFFENREQFPLIAKKVEDQLTELRFAPQSRSLEQVAKRQQSLLEKHTLSNRNLIFWFSDFQRSTAGELEKISLDTLNQYYLVPIKAEKIANIAIDSVWLANPFIKANESNQINVLVRNYGQEAKENLVLKLFINEKQVSTTSVSLAAQNTNIAQFNFMIEAQGFQPCKITFEDFPVVFDNEYFFVLNTSPTVNILHLSNEKNVFIDNVFANESIFRLQNFSVNNLDFNRLDVSELVILSNVSEIEGELRNRLTEYLRKGGNLVVFPSSQPQESLVNFLKTLTLANLKTLKVDSLGKGKNNELRVMDVNNPFFKGFFDKVPNNVQMPWSNAVLQCREGNLLLSQKDQNAFLTRFAVGRGNLYLFTNPLQDSHTNFAKHALFVPVMYRLASLSKSAEQRLAYRFEDKTLTLPITNAPKNTTFSLRKYNDKQPTLIRPAQRLQGEMLWLEIPEQLNEAGFYELLANDKPLQMIAFNYDKAESDMNFYTAEQLRNIFAKRKNVQVFDSTKNKNFVQDFKEKNVQYNLWKYMLIVALFFLLLETALIRLM
ncbi:MAG: BatA domain-containing protein [Microscillaceae bacterium]|nr:BatA domain-containing protein [Microscillaceae bacterium]MDW8459658.1 BatA domain-containing protein [Cytophagales bacterium]